MASFTSIHLTEIEINEFSSDSGFYNGVCMAMILTSAVILFAAVMQMRAAIQFNIRGNTMVKTEPRIDRKRGHLLPSKKGNLPQENQPVEQNINEPQAVIYYSKDGFKSGIFHMDKHCCRLRNATQKHVRSIDFWRAQGHRPCQFCGNKMVSVPNDNLNEQEVHH